jgi:hypothetical protein
MESPLYSLLSLKWIIPAIVVLALLAFTFITIYQKTKKKDDA